MPSPKVKGEESDENQQDDEETPEEEVEEEVDEETPDEEEEVDVEEAELPDEEENEDEESTGGSLLSGSTFGISNKWLLGIGLAAIIAVLLLRSMDANSSTRTYEDDEQVDDEIEEGSEGEVEQQVTDAGGSVGRFDPQAQDDAIGEVFG